MSAPPPKFENRNPELPQFWQERFAARFTPWDSGAAPRQAQEFVRDHAPRTVLLPGCGNAWEVACFAAYGWTPLALDFAPAAVQQARARLAQQDPALAACVQEGDFFSWQPAQPLGAIYERAFFCALPPAQRVRIVQRWAELLPEGGLLFGYFFIDPAADAVRGPPFTIQAPVLQGLMETAFDCLVDQAASDSIDVFAARERWQVWRRRVAHGISQSQESQ
ncbi:methyltransferase domain-containing protein [Massilia sp. W12]|uniref:methyltransferase domain-containing protein n=1 Tax=Massilia sp. W12 TaxID=3126507 RepID=UPI0030CBF8EF